MKKTILLACLVWLSYHASSQTIGLKGGINLASQVWKVDGLKVKPDFRTGALAGFTLNLEESKKFSIQLELSYSQMGFGKTTIDGTELPEGNFKYAKVGSAIKYHYVRAANIHGGAELGFGFDKVKDLKYLENLDFGVFFGTEYYFTPYFGAGGRYYLGISDVGSGDSDGNTVKQFNRAFQIYVAFRFPSKQLKEMGY